VGPSPITSSALPGAPVRRAVTRPSTRLGYAIGALVMAVLVSGFAWVALTAYRHSLAVSSFTITGEPKNTNFEVFRCGATTRYKTGRIQADGTATVSVPPGCWEARPGASGSKGFEARTAHAPRTTGSALALAITTALGVASLGLFYPAVRSLRSSRRARDALSRDDFVNTRILAEQARQSASYAFGFGAATLIIALGFLFLSAANGGVRTPFFRFSLMTAKFGTILDAFATNVKIFLIAEAFVLVWGLLVAIARLAPGRAGRPVRALAIFYIDLFRGVPAVITIYLLDLGLKKAGIPWVSSWDDFWFAVLALTLTYGAYVAEVYRAGIESIHWSQTAAARSLGLSYPRTLRYVVVPQAVRRIIPPLLNDFIGLQKDTSLVGFVGVVEAFNQARIINSNEFNLSALTMVAFLFYVITVPQARLVDYLIRRDQAKMRANG